MYMEFATGVEGSTAYLCYFNKKRLIKILHSWGINDFRGFLKNYIWDDTDAMMCEFEDRGWSYKKVACEFQSEKEIFEELNKMESLTANDALKRLNELNVTYLTEGWYSVGNSTENLDTNAELDEIFGALENWYATDEFLNQLSAEHDSMVWLVNFEKSNKWQALFYDEDLNEIWIDL